MDKEIRNRCLCIASEMDLLIGLAEGLSTHLPIEQSNRIVEILKSRKHRVNRLLGEIQEEKNGKDLSGG